MDIAESPQAAASPYSSTVKGVLARLFGAINDRSYEDYLATLDDTTRQSVSEATFDDEFGALTFSDIYLESVGMEPSGQIQATMRFTRKEVAPDEPNGETCTNWLATYGLSLNSTGQRVLTTASNEELPVQQATC